jgi:hypothetical protein
MKTGAPRRHLLLNSSGVYQIKFEQELLVLTYPSALIGLCSRIQSPDCGFHIVIECTSLEINSRLFSSHPMKQAKGAKFKTILLALIGSNVNSFSPMPHEAMKQLHRTSEQMFQRETLEVRENIYLRIFKLERINLCIKIFVLGLTMGK